MRAAILVLPIALVTGGITSNANAGCETDNVRIVFWASSWWQEQVEYGCDRDNLIDALDLAAELYGPYAPSGFSYSDVVIRWDGDPDNTANSVEMLVGDVCGGTTKTLYLLGHGGNNGYNAMVFVGSDSFLRASGELYGLLTSGWFEDEVAMYEIANILGTDGGHAIRILDEGINARLAPCLSPDVLVFAIHSFSSHVNPVFTWEIDLSLGTYVSYGSTHSALGAQGCEDLENATGTLLCAFWPEINNELYDFQRGGAGYTWNVSGNINNQLVCGVGCQNLAALLSHVEAFDGQLFWAARAVQDESYFIPRGYRTFPGQPEELPWVDGGEPLSMGDMRTYAVSVPLGYAAFDVVEIDDAGRETVSESAIYGKKSGVWDKWKPNHDYDQAAYTRQPRERSSDVVITGEGVRSSLALIASNPEWVRRYDGGLQRTRVRAEESRAPERFGTLSDLVKPSAPSGSGSTVVTDDPFLADAILWAYDPVMIADLGAHLGSFQTSQGYPYKVRWFWTSGVPTVANVHSTVNLVLQANASHPGPRTYPARPPLWFIGEDGWTSWPETMPGTCMGNCYGYRRYYPGTGRKPVIVVPTDDVEDAQLQIMGAEEWNAGTAVHEEGKVMCFVGDYGDTAAASSWMRRNYDNFDEAFSISGRPVEFHYESDHAFSALEETQQAGYDAINSGAQYFFESAILHSTDRWSRFAWDYLPTVRPFDPLQLVTEQRTFWVVSSCEGTGFQLDDGSSRRAIGKMLLYGNSLYHTTAVGILGPMVGAWDETHALYLEYVQQAMVEASGSMAPVPWWKVAEDAAQAMLNDHGSEAGIPDLVDALVLYAANPMLEPGTLVVSPSVKGDISTFARVIDTGELKAMPDTTATGCPKGDREEIVVFVEIADDQVAGPIPAGAITMSAPLAGNIIFHAPVVVDSAPSHQDGVYKTSITISEFSKCGEDSALVSLYGIALGYAELNVKNFDMVISQTYPGVHLADLSYFTSHFPSSICDCVAGKKPYAACADFVPLDTAVTLGDFTVLYQHYLHKPPGPPSSVVATEGTISNGRVLIELEERHPLIGPRLLRGHVALETTEKFDVMLLGLKNTNELFEFLTWRQDPECPGRTIVTETVRDNQREIAIGISGGENIGDGRIDLGYFEVEVHSREPLSLSDDDFQLVIGDLMDKEGKVSTLSRSASAGFNRTFRPASYQYELAQNYPNPFNPTTTIAYSVARNTEVELVIFDVRGARVRTLVNAPHKPNNYKLMWDGNNERGDPVASGIYFYLMRAGEFRATKKLVLLR